MIHLDTTQPIRTVAKKKVTRHGTRVQGMIKKDPRWYGPDNHTVEWNLAQQPRPVRNHASDNLRTPDILHDP